MLSMCVGASLTDGSDGHITCSGEPLELHLLIQIVGELFRSKSEGHLSKVGSLSIGIQASLYLTDTLYQQFGPKSIV